MELVRNSGASVTFHILDESSYKQAKASGVNLSDPKCTPVANGEAKESPKPKLCYLVKPSSGFGFSLRSIKGKIWKCSWGQLKKKITCSILNSYQQPWYPCVKSLTICSLFTAAARLPRLNIYCRKTPSFVCIHWGGEISRSFSLQIHQGHAYVPTNSYKLNLTEAFF